jgi:4-amino-4-deoxy-L-arabinose transferase-like glycosyltransferase
VRLRSATGAISPFHRTLLIIVAGAFAVRLVYAWAFAPGLTPFGDDTFFHYIALDLAHGEGYVGSFDIFVTGTKLPTAEHPPLYPLALSVIALLGGEGLDAQRLLGVLAGSITVLGVGLVAARAAGPRAGLAAALLCAVYPAFIAADAAIMSESLFGALVVFALFQTLRLLDQPSTGGMAILGVLVGCAALTRSEGLLLLVLLPIPVVVRAPGRRLTLLAVVAGSTVLVVTPWVVRNWSQFGQPVFSTNEGTTLAGANCDATYYGSLIGGFTISCASHLPLDMNPAERADVDRRKALHYAREHVGRSIAVAGFRVLRLLGLYAPGSQFTVDGRDREVQRVGVFAYYAILLAGIAGAIVLVRRRRTVPLLVILMPVAVSIMTAALTYGFPRMRHIAEVSLLVLAGVALAQVGRAVSGDAAPRVGARPVGRRALQHSR